MSVHGGNRDQTHEMHLIENDELSSKLRPIRSLLSRLMSLMCLLDVYASGVLHVWEIFICQRHF